MTTAAPPRIALDLPEGFTVLAAADATLVDVVAVPAPLVPWHDEVLRARAAAGASLVALQVEQLPEPTAVALAVHLAPLAPAPPAVVVQGLRALALTRTSPAGEVALLDLPLGSAVACADVQDDARGAVAVATVQLPLPLGSWLVTLTLSTPAHQRLAALAALAAAVAARLHLLEHTQDRRTPEER